ncbi:MAG: ABC transporter permease [Clostridiales bacterium]|nr:ABC transporter permease [Clostridiales bacterium]
MKILFKNIIRSVKGHPRENIIILLNMILCTMTVFVLLQNYYFLKEHFDLVYGSDQVARHYSIVMSEEDNKAMRSDLLNRSPMYYVGKDVEKDIMNTPHLELYYYTYLQVPLSSFTERENIEKYAYVDEDLKRYLERIGEESEYSFMNILTVSENCDDVFKLRILKGRFLGEEDQNTNDPDIPVPVVLGNDFAESFDIGDIIELDGDRLVVIGILEDNMYMNGWGAVEYLDNMILTLCPTIPRSFDAGIEDYDYQKLLIYQYVYCDDESVDVQKEINRITAENGYYTYEVQPIDGIEISETKDVSSKNVVLVGLLALIACIICTCSLGSVLHNRTIQDRSVYCIHLCCGTPLWKINCSITLEMILYLMISFFPTLALSIIEYGGLMVPVWQILLFSGVIVFISLMPVFRLNKDNNLDMLIRDKII